jgi:hypothetical protein
MKKLLATIGATLGIAALVAATSPLGSAVLAGITALPLD